MKNIFKISLLAFVVTFFIACQEENQTFGNIVAPTNIVVQHELVGQDSDNPNGDGSGLVNFMVTADNALSYKYSFGDAVQNAPSGETSFTFSELGVNTYLVTVVAYGTGGLSSTTTLEVEVLATYAPPADLLNTLVGDGSKTWRIKAEQTGHFGLGPVGGVIPTEWYGAGAGEKSATGMYDDRYIFNADGTFTHITNSFNDDPVEDASGTVFGREPLIAELGAHNETANGADIENYPYSDYTENWVITAPGGIETLNLRGLGFIGYYTGGNHSYQIFNRDTPNELIIKTTDGNNEFDWWFIITSEEEEEEGATNETLATNFETLVWSDEFDLDGAPNATNWTYDLGASGWGNGEQQNYTNNLENASVSEGILTITAKKEGAGYTSARLKSEGLFDFTYGRVEVRAKLPTGGGTWPAIWMLGSDYQTNTWPACGEIDIMEHVGNNQNVVSGTLHYPEAFAGNADGSDITVDTVSSAFHNYTVEWSPDVIKIAVDNEVYHTYTNTEASPFNKDFFLILNIAMGGSFGGSIDPAFTESSMEIDYVRVYQE